MVEILAPEVAKKILPFAKPSQSIALSRLSIRIAFSAAAKTFTFGKRTYISITKIFFDPIRVLATVKNYAVNTVFSIWSITKLSNFCFLNTEWNTKMEK